MFSHEMEIIKIRGAPSLDGLQAKTPVGAQVGVKSTTCYAPPLELTSSQHTAIANAGMQSRNLLKKVIAKQMMHGLEAAPCQNRQ
jgi:hypothetical protein